MFQREERKNRHTRKIGLLFRGSCTGQEPDLGFLVMSQLLFVWENTNRLGLHVY